MIGQANHILFMIAKAIRTANERAIKINFAELFLKE